MGVIGLIPSPRKTPEGRRWMDNLQLIAAGLLLVLSALAISEEVLATTATST